MSADGRARIAGSPISWGVCEVPGWGYQLPPDRVLAEMREVGLAATELGPDGFLPREPDAMVGVLARPHAHEGPVADVWTSAEYLRSLLGGRAGGRG